MIPSIANIRKAIYCLNKRLDLLEGGEYSNTVTELSNKVHALESILNDDILNPTAAIDKFNEIVAFLDSINNTETLLELLRDVILLSYQQNYVTVPTYASLPATGSADTIYRVSNYNGSTNQIDTTSYSEYVWDNSDYTLLCVKSLMSEVFDISAYHAIGGTLATYSDLSAALDSNNGGGVPQSFQKGGMRIQFVRTSDNKYVQYRLMSAAWSDTVSDWQGCGDKAEEIKYNNSNSGLVAENVQAAVDNLANNLICIEELIDIANIVPYSGKFINTEDNKWHEAIYYKYLIIPIEYLKNANILNIVGRTGTFIAFLAGNDETLDNTPQYCNGCALENLSNKTKKILIPSDCNFIYISHSYEETDRLPLSVTGITTVSVETRWLSNVKRLKLKGFKGFVSLSGSTIASPEVSGDYYSNYSYIIHPVNQGDAVEIKGKGNGAAYTWGLIDSADNNRIVQSSNIDATTNSTIIVIPTGVDKIVINNYNLAYSDYEWYYYEKESINADVVKQKFANHISYDNSQSRLAAENVNDAIDLLAQKDDGGKLAIDSYIVQNKYIDSQGVAVSISPSSTYKYDSVVKLPINRLRNFVVSGSTGSSYIVIFDKNNNVLLSLQGTNVYIDNTEGLYHYISFGTNVLIKPLYIRGKINTLEQRNIAILGDSIMMLLSQGGITGGTTTYVGIQDGITYDFSQLTNIGGLLYVTSTLVNGAVTSNTIQAEVHNSNQANLDIETWPALKDVLNANYIINTGRGGARIHGNVITTPYPAYAEVKFNTIPNHCLELKRRVDAGEPSPDVILIWAGTNDFRHFIENGQWIEPTNFDEIMSLDYNSQLLANTNEAMTYKRTFYGAMRFIIEYLYRNFPNATIVFFSPIPSTVDGRNYDNTRKIGSYMKRICERYAVLYVDACVEMGITDIFDTETKHKWLTDGLHPNDAGKILYTNYTAKKLEEIFFDKIYG